MRYVRAGGPSRSGLRLQEWRSELTGRAFEVDERDAYAAAEELEPGDEGYLSFVGGTAVVTRQPADPPRRPGSRSAADGGPSGRGVPARLPAPRRRAWLWLLGAAVVLALLVMVLRP